MSNKENTEKKVILKGRLTDGQRASTFGSCTNTRIVPGDKKTKKA